MILFLVDFWGDGRGRGRDRTCVTWEGQKEEIDVRLFGSNV